MSPRLSAVRRAALRTLATRLGGSALAAEVTLAADDPHAYLAKFKDRMADIHVDEPRKELAWLALTEGLSARKQVVELDWKHEADDALVAVQRLAGAAGKKALAPIARDPQLAERRTDEALEQFGGALAKAKLALLQLDKSSDSYAVMVAPAAQAKPLMALARQGGGAIHHFTGKGFAALELERTRAQAKEAAARGSTNRWTRLAQTDWRNNTDGVLWKLRHHPYPVEDIRAAMPDAPLRDRPLIAMVLALHDQPATKLARTTRDPKLCLRALRYLGQEHRFAGERLGASALLAERLRIPPGNGPLNAQVAEACNLFGDDAADDRALAKVPAAGRARLARLADALLAGAKHQSERWNIAYRALRTVGDEASIPGIEASRARVWKQFAGAEIQEIEEALARIRGRTV